MVDGAVGVALVVVDDVVLGTVEEVVAEVEVGLVDVVAVLPVVLVAVGVVVVTVDVVVVEVDVLVGLLSWCEDAGAEECGELAVDWGPYWTGSPRAGPMSWGGVTFAGPGTNSPSARAAVPPAMPRPPTASVSRRLP